MTALITKTAGARSKISNGLSQSRVLTGAYLTPTMQSRKKSGQRLFLAGRDGLLRTFCTLSTSSNDSLTRFTSSPDWHLVTFRKFHQIIISYLAKAFDLGTLFTTPYGLHVYVKHQVPLILVSAFMFTYEVVRSMYGED